MDPNTMFAMIFGSENFVHLLGELQMASMTTLEDANNPSRVMWVKQQKREVQCALNLRDKLDSLDDLSEASINHFRKAVENEAQELGSTEFGCLLM